MPLLFALLIAFLTWCCSLQLAPLTPKEGVQKWMDETLASKGRKPAYIKEELTKFSFLPPLTPEEGVQKWMDETLAPEGGKLAYLKEEPTPENLRIRVYHTNLPDGSVTGEQWVFLFRKDKGQWRLTSVKRNWQCGRGEEKEWGIHHCP